MKLQMPSICISILVLLLVCQGAAQSAGRGSTPVFASSTVPTTLPTATATPQQQGNTADHPTGEVGAAMDAEAAALWRVVDDTGNIHFSPGGVIFGVIVCEWIGAWLAVPMRVRSVDRLQGSCWLSPRY